MLGDAGSERRVVPLPCLWGTDRSQPQVPQGCRGTVGPRAGNKALVADQESDFLEKVGIC